MREDDDSEIRYFMPVVRRLIILTAVIIAVPVVMWTITGVVRTYLGPVRPPAIQTMAVSPVPAPEQTATIPTNNPPAPTPADTKSAELPPIPTMNTAANVPSGSQNSAAPGMAMAPSAAPVAPPAPAPVPTTSSKMAMSSPAAAAPLPANPAPPAASLAPPPAVSAPPVASVAPSAAPSSPDRASNSVWPDPPTAPLASASPIAPVADAVPASEPIAGPVPLPRKRPRSFAVAQASIPTPRPRPAPTAATQNTAYAVTPVAADAPSSPFDWLRRLFQPSLFQPSSPTAATGPQEDLSAAH
jgi:hypothetical protein